MLNVFRKFLRPTLREQLEDGVREALRRYAERQTAPNLRVYVSTDLVPEGFEESLWARDEAEHLRRFALQWAEDNSVPRVGLRTEVVVLDTKREFAFVKPIGLDAEEAGEGPKRSAQSVPSTPIARQAPAAGTAVLEVVSSPGPNQPLRIAEELTVGRKGDGEGVFGVGDRYMSARHARLHVAGGKLYVTDLDSKNRTYVNDRPVPPHQQVAVDVGDQIRMGTTTLRVAEVGS
ncbi:MAG: FHA domain-containing protein [Gemmatimonadota bacterium]